MTTTATLAGVDTITFKLQGISPAIMHNGRLANPLDPFSKAMKVITSKRDKTDDDYLELSRIELEGGLYMGADGPEWPATNIEAMMYAAAKKFKEGPKFKEGCIVLASAPLQYDGPKDVDGLWENRSKFVSYEGVKNQRNTVMRTRAIFPNWSLSFVLQYETDLVDRRIILKWADAAGRRIGLSDWRPRHGRFIVVSPTE